MYHIIPLQSFNQKCCLFRTYCIAQGSISTYYSVITYMGKEPEEEWIYVYV